MSPLTLKKSRANEGSVSKVSLDRRRQERMCSGDALATPHFAQTGKNFVTVAEGATPQVTADKSGQRRLVGSVTGKANGATRTAPLIPIMGWRDPPRL
ncbi:hypothetical protein AVEN_165219-1 [Araneus ventricosus]|uniref:Uncharacterized protein n=1 Tax=Araneus ventricosus TaxID=182803 RepID=A0A4Y2B5H3_ARAVE|nr:hypothetical protein AVEN_165219-1 [Araneus ventricosus]